MSKKNKAYAYYLVETGETGIVADWSACAKKVQGKNARYKGFTSTKDAKAWLLSGAGYDVGQKKKQNTLLSEGVYFDAGTGRGIGVEVRVTDRDGNGLLSEILSKNEINEFGNYQAPEGATNNYGELLGCKFALLIAQKNEHKNIFGDSGLVITYWSKGIIKRDAVAPETVALADEVTKLRSAFEKTGGTISHISGDDNPADLGFHK